MKKFLAVIITILLTNISLSAHDEPSTEPSTAENSQKEAAKDRWVNGKEQYEKFSQDYKAGKFRDQLTKLNDDVKKISDEQPNLFNQTLEHARENKQKIEQINDANEKIMAKGIEELKAACQGSKTGEICGLVASLENNSNASKAFNQAFIELHNLALQPDQSKYDAFTQKTVEIVNNGMKKLLYPMYSRQPIDQFNPALPKAIEMEMVEELQQAASKEPNHPLAKKITIIVDNYPEHYANFVDSQNLALLAHGKITPQNAAEESAQKIALKIEQEKREQLRTLFPAATNSKE